MAHASPNKPFADGKPYATTGLQKVIVLMTDGVNELIDNANNASGYNSAHVSDYSSYGYLGGARLWSVNNIQTYSGFQTHLDNRVKDACTAAKNAGVIIYTVTFSHTGYLTSSAGGRAKPDEELREQDDLFLRGDRFRHASERFRPSRSRRPRARCGW
ncbi:MAG: hypothetical protein H6871_05590 [Methylobacteriaceae bacterium]|nr:hypothetical protein [Methylobacteriaceae bacterium]